MTSHLAEPALRNLSDKEICSIAENHDDLLVRDLAKRLRDYTNKRGTLRLDELPIGGRNITL